ncbi:class I SAM-dependent methyltransferase [Streptomyces atratus]|uniref:class I SAM-dependent methyltransferase n=1 Tax=Streptomyces atratus TaxID=1893 RepID=UPI0021A2859C|nr:class I SAM-dependent methyltransferase [Streptomyces atratus]MCT2547994.1 class I SAM-dependent methyltransferase [Streptomyces atratus]
MADDYARYRPGVPEAAVRLPADALRDRLDPVLLDLGTGTGQVPLALRHAVPGLAHIEAVDVSRQILDRARDALAPVLGRCTLALVHAAADKYRPLAPQSGTAVPEPDLVTCCRSYHWMPGPAVLDMADRVTSPHAAVAIMGDGSLWTHDSEWTRALRELISLRCADGQRRRTHERWGIPLAAPSPITEIPAEGIGW